MPSTLVLTFLAATMLSPALADGATKGNAGVEIGQVAPAGKLHIVTEPGRYGLGPELPGSHYAVVGDLLIRIDAETRVVQSIIRKVNGIRD